MLLGVGVPYNARMLIQIELLLHKANNIVFIYFLKTSILSCQHKMASLRSLNAVTIPHLLMFICALKFGISLCTPSNVFLTVYSSLVANEMTGTLYTLRHGYR